MAHKATKGFLESENQLARFAKALGHPARTAVFAAISLKSFL